MPLTHTRTFRVRYYECDAYGHLNNANYVRYMQETAFDASAAAGYDAARYAEMGRQWLIRNTEIEYLRPLRYGDLVEVKTWVADFRRASSRRMYEFRHSNGELVARGHSDWVFIDVTTGQPAAVPPELSRAFFPEGLPDSFQPREPFPATPPPPLGVFAMRLPVRWRDIDSLKHVNNAVYLEFIEECAFQVIAAHGWPWTRMAEEGFAILLRKHQIQYLQPARMGDELEVTTWASNIKRSTAIRHYLIRRVCDGVEIARVNTVGVWVELSTGRPMRIPPGFMEDFAPNLVR